MSAFQQGDISILADMTLYDAIHSQRAIRHFKPDPVDDELIEQMLEAATRAPSAANSQPWRFIVVRDRETKAKLGGIFDELGQARGWAPDRTPWEDVPVLIAVCSESPSGQGRTLHLEASVLPAVQNLLLTARALGLGTVLTTRWQAREDEVRPLVGLPENAQIHAIVPTGWPLDRFGRTTRRPVPEVTYRERWGASW
jgi:nitroreductase